MMTEPLRGLYERRCFRDLTLEKAGDIIGVSPSHYQKIERGHTRLDVHRAKTLAEALECSIEELL